MGDHAGPQAGTDPAGETRREAGPSLVAARRDVGIDPAFLTFDDRADEELFRAEYQERMAKLTRRAIAAGAPGYVLMAVILDVATARTAAVVMTVILAGWIALSWNDLNVRYYNQVTIGIEGVLSAVSMVMLLALPPQSAVVISIAFITLNFMWIFVFLRPLFPWALALGVAYLATVVAGGSIIWDQYGAGRAPEGLIGLFGGRGGGALIVFLYAGFLLVLTSSVAYRLEKAERVDYLLRRELDAAHARSEQLLTNVLPGPVAERLKDGENPIADDFSEVSVVFADLVGFTSMSAAMDPGQLLALLNSIFSEFDALATKHGLEKIKTIGDAYMAVAGAPHPMDGHADAAAAMALDMLAVVRAVRLPGGAPLEVRIGIGSGPAVAGVIGTSKFIYDLWGDTVNTASRMESHGIPGRVQVAEPTRRLLGTRFAVEDRGDVEVKGKGVMHTWLLDEATRN